MAKFIFKPYLEKTMPTKVAVGLCKKQGLPDYGSVGASCNVEFELDAHVIDDDPERFRQHVRRAYAICRESVEQELLREQASGSVSSSHSNEKGQEPQNGSSGPNGKGRAATQNQIRAIKGIAARNQIDLGPLIGRFGVRSADELSIGEASLLIDELKGKAAENGSGR